MSIQNGQATSMIVITRIIPGKLESLKAALAFVGNKKPSESPIALINSIHYATWTIIDDGTRLLFNTNFDGNWEKYLLAFIEKASSGLDAIWSNCEDYPGTTPPDKFIAYVKRYEINAQLFYAAYPDTTLNQVQKSLRIQNKFQELLNEFS